MNVEFEGVFHDRSGQLVILGAARQVLAAVFGSRHERQAAVRDVAVGRDLVVVVVDTKNKKRIAGDRKMN